MEKTESPKNTRIEALLSEQRGENMKERTVSILKEDGVGYGLTVSGDNPVFVQAVKEDGPAARAGVHAGDRILMVNDRCVSKSGHVEVVQLIKTAKVVNLRLLGIPSLKSKTSLTSLPPMARRKSGTMMDQVISPPIHATERDKQRAVELKSTTLERMLKQEQQFYKDRCVEYTKSPTPKLEKEINDSSGRIQTLERQLSVSEIKVQLVVAPQPVASQAVSTSEESSVAAMERHSVAVDRSVSTTSMPDSKTGTPIGKRKRKSKKSSSSSQPDSPLSPLCSNGHTVRINSDGRSGSTLDFNTTVSDVSHNSVANICIDASDEDEDMKTDDSTGPFSDLALLEKMPAHLAVFVNYLISDTSHDPSNLFFYLVSGVYQRYQGTKDLKRMANDIYQTFFLLTAPLKLDIESAIVKHIESTFKSKSATDESLHVVFSKARECAFAVVARQLSVFRAKRALGLGSMFGDTVLSEHLPKSNYVEVISQLLLPPLQQMTSSHGDESPQTKNKREAMASCLAIFLQDVGVKLKLKSDANRLASFTNTVKLTTKSSGLFKNKKVHVISGHEFVANHYHYPTFCDHCDGLLWGFGFQGYQCQVCGFNVHKQSCNTNLQEMCAGPGRKSPVVRLGSLWVDLNKRKRKNSKRSKSQPSASDYSHGADGLTRLDSFNPSFLRAGSQSSQRSGRVTSLVKSYEQKNATSIPTVHLSAHEGGAIMPVAEEDMEMMIRRSRGSSVSVFFGDKAHKERKGQLGRSRSLKLLESEKSRLLSQQFTRSVDHAVSMCNLRDEENIDEAGRIIQSPSEEGEMGQDEDMMVDETLIPWTDFVEKSVLKDVSPREIKRQEVIHELVHTERTHLKKLKTIYYVYYVPLQSSKHVSPTKVDELFPQLIKIIEIHGYVVKSLKERYNECQMQEETRGRLTLVGDIMLGLFDSVLGDELIDACSEFVSSQIASLEFIKAMRSKSKDFDRFMQRCEAMSVCSRLQISDLVSTVMSRLTKYPLLLEKLLKHTDKSDPDYAFIENALDASKETLMEVNEQVALTENHQFLKEIQRKLDTSPLEKAGLQLEETKNFSLVLPGRELLYVGCLSWKIVKQRTTNVYGLLLSDMLVLLEHNEDKDRYLLKPRPDPNIKGDRSPIITFRDLFIRDVATDKKAFFVLSTSSGGPQMHELVARSFTERETWIMKLNEAAAAWKATIVKGGQALQTGSERRRKSTPEKFIEPSGLSDSEEDQLEVTETTTEQLQGCLRQQTDVIAGALDKKATLLQRLKESLPSTSDQSAANNPEQLERENLCKESPLEMRLKVLDVVEQADLVTRLVNQLAHQTPLQSEETKTDDVAQLPNESLVQALVSAAASMNSRLARLLEPETAEEARNLVSESDSVVDKSDSLQRPRSQVISESRARGSFDRMFPPLSETISEHSRSSPMLCCQRHASPNILELQQTIEKQLSPASSPVLEKQRSFSCNTPALHLDLEKTETEESGSPTDTSHSHQVASPNDSTRVIATLESEPVDCDDDCVAFEEGGVHVIAAENTNDVTSSCTVDSHVT